MPTSDPTRNSSAGVRDRGARRIVTVTITGTELSATATIRGRSAPITSTIAPPSGSGDLGWLADGNADQGTARTSAMLPPRTPTQAMRLWTAGPAASPRSGPVQGRLRRRRHGDGDHVA